MCDVYEYIQGKLNNNVSYTDIYYNAPKEIKEEVDLYLYEKFNFDVDDIKNYQQCEVRTEQDKFKQTLVERYKQCVVTGDPFDICDGAHIIPYCNSYNDQKYDTNNGLLLTPSVHRLFDQYKITINPKTSKIELHENILNDDNYKNYHQYHNKKIKLNSKTLKYLKYHHGIFVQK